MKKNNILTSGNNLIIYATQVAYMIRLLIIIVYRPTTTVQTIIFRVWMVWRGSQQRHAEMLDRKKIHLNLILNFTEHTGTHCYTHTDWHRHILGFIMKPVWFVPARFGWTPTVFLILGSLKCCSGWRNTSWVFCENLNNSRSTAFQVLGFFSAVTHWGEVGA